MLRAAYTRQMSKLLCLFGQADFSFYFDTGGRRRCYIAPERFYESGTSDPGQLAMQRLLPEMVGPAPYIGQRWGSGDCREP